MITGIVSPLVVDCALCVRVVLLRPWYYYTLFLLFLLYVGGIILFFFDSIVDFESGYSLLSIASGFVVGLELSFVKDRNVC